MLRKTVVTIFLGLFVAFSAQAARIENISGVPASGDFLVFPARKEIILDKARSEAFEISILNRTGQTQSYSLEVKDIRGITDGEQGYEIGPYGDLSHALAKFVSVSDKNIILNSSQVAHIPVSINFPDGNFAGGYYGIILISQQSSGGSGQAKVAPRVGIPLLLKLEGEQKPGGLLKDFRVLQEKNKEGAFDLRVYFENNGNIHLMPSGKVEVFDFWGQKKGETTISKFFSLPNSYKMVKGSWQTQDDINYYRFVASINKGYGDSIDKVSKNVFIISPRGKNIIFTIGGILVFLILLIIGKKWKRNSNQ